MADNESLEEEPSFSLDQPQSDLLGTAQETLARLKALSEKQDWQKFGAEYNGVQISSLKEKPDDKSKATTVYRGQVLLEGVKPEDAFAVLSDPAQWDDWFVQMSTVDNLADTASHLYFVVDAVPSSHPRDLSLVEMTETASDGTVYLCSTSVSSTKVPTVEGRTRAHVDIMGWILSPTSADSTTATLFFAVKGRALYTKLFPHRHIAKHAATCLSNVQARTTNQQMSSPKRKKRMSMLIPGASIRSKNRAISGASSINTSSPARPVSASYASSVNSSNTPMLATNGHADPDVEPQSKIDENASAASTALPIEDESPEMKELHSRFTSLLQESKSWTLSKDNEGNSIWTKQDGVLPIVRADVEIRVPKGCTTEDVLGVVKSTVSRQTWSKRHASISLHQEQERVYHLECVNGITPHMSPTHHLVEYSARRDNVASDRSSISLVGQSIPDSLDKSNSTPTKLHLSGWQIEATRNGRIQVSHIRHAEPKESSLPAFIGKVIAVAIMRDLRHLAAFIESQSLLPIWLRWGSGSVQITSHTASLEENTSTYTLKPLSSASSEKQRCLIQWNANTYSTGLSLSLEPASAATVTLSSAFRRTVEFTWSGEEEAVLKLSPWSEGTANDACLNGEKLQANTSTAVNGVDAHDEHAEELHPGEHEEDHGTREIQPVFVAAGNSEPLEVRHDKSKKNHPDLYDALPAVGRSTVLLLDFTIEQWAVVFLFCSVSFVLGKVLR